MYCTCHTMPRRRLSAPQLLQNALRTAPATQKHAAATAATIRAAAPSGSSAYCTCHTMPRRRLSAPQLLQNALRTAPATQKHAAATAATIRAAAPSGSSAYCACHTKASRGHGGDYPRRSPFGKLCVLRLPHKSTPRPRRRLSAPQLLREALRTAPAAQKRAAATAATILLQEALRTAPATQKHAAATAATIRAAAPSGRSVYCARHAKASRGHGGDYPRRSSFRFRKLCVLRLPHKSEPRPRRRLSAPQLPQEAMSCVR